MTKRFTFSRTITAVGIISVLICIRLSYWQYERHEQKLVEIAAIKTRLNEPVIPLLESIRTKKNPLDPNEWSSMPYRRVSVTCSFDYPHEMVLRNRRYQGFPGVHAITPCHMMDSSFSILVSRGFIPLSRSSQEKRAPYQRPSTLSFTGLIKESVAQKFLAPRDPPAGGESPWVDAWLRVDIASMQQQLPYSVLPVYLEIMETPDAQGVEEQIVADKGGREDVFFIADGEKKIRSDAEIPHLQYPAPVYDTVIPPGRHRGYIFEWLGIGALIGGACCILQLNRKTKIS